jgi:hypothetical protein
MLVSSIVIEIKILLIDQILDHFVRHTVLENRAVPRVPDGTCHISAYLSPQLIWLHSMIPLITKFDPPQFYSAGMSKTSCTGQKSMTCLIFAIALSMQ